MLNRETLKTVVVSINSNSLVCFKMPKSKKKRSSEGPMPAAGAGLIRFFADQSEGIKVGPVAVLIISISLIVMVLLAWFNVFGALLLPTP